MATNGMAPDLLPVLTRGKHRSPRRGACFMELASFLAGERWSDHPQCTHRLLAGVARMVNDSTSDAGRQGLAGLIPDVIGLTSNDPRLDVLIARRAAFCALPVATAERQRALAVGILASERVLAKLDGRPPGDLTDESRRALSDVPHARDWALRYSHAHDVPLERFRAMAAPSIVRTAVLGIANACISDRDRALRELLESAIDEARWLAAERSPVPADQRRAATASVSAAASQRS